MEDLRTTFDTEIHDDVATLRVIGDTSVHQRVAAFHETVARLVARGAMLPS